MQKFKFSLLVFFILTSSILPQNKLLTIDDVVLGGQRLIPKNLRQLSWQPGSNRYTWVEGSAILSSDLKSAGIDTALTLKKLNDQLKNKSQNNIGVIPSFTWIAKGQIGFWNSSIFNIYDLEKSDVTKIIILPKESDNKVISPKFNYAAFTKLNNLFIMKDGNEIPVTNDADSNIVNGQSVHRNEFGIDGGIFWSPNENYVAFYRMDESMVTDYPLVEIQPTPAKLKNIKYPMAGQMSHHVTVGIYDLKNNKTVWLNTGEPKEQYLTNISWSPDEKYIFIAHLNRDQNHMELKRYDVFSGNYISTLFEEKHEKYVEPENPMIFLPNSNDLYLWFSERDGWKHLYLYSLKNGFIKQLTKGTWDVTRFEGFDKEGKNIFISCTKDSPIERHAYKINIEKNSVTKLTDGAGVHSIVINQETGYYLDSYTNSETPRIINLKDNKGKLLRNVLKADNSLKDYAIGDTRIFSIKSDEGIELYCRMILPYDFDESRKYPVVFYVYGGPHAQEVLNVFGVNRYYLWSHFMAQKGFIVFTLDNRGSANRGLEFEQATFRKLGTVEVKDQLTGLQYLKSLPFIDQNRVGVFGWSYGGFMATSLLTRTDGAFKVGVGGGAVIDWKYYEVMYTERYMDTPQTNPEGYEEANLLNHAKNLNGKLLLVHGTSDPTVVWQNTLAFAKKCTELNKDLDYYPFIGHGHGVGGRDAVNLYTKISQYFLDNL
ncbi:MAG: S9 family peptidase [Melioribacteraceae bacterium]|nr:S9 family peptidase [Melioribacteraceae bacterium]